MRYTQGSTRSTHGSISHSSSPYFSVRQQFVTDLKTAIGDICDTSLPAEIRVLVTQLIETGDLFMQLGSSRFEAQLLKICNQAIHSAKQTKGLMSFWVSSEQSRCYALYWGLKAALQQYQSQKAEIAKTQLDLFSSDELDEDFGEDFVSTDSSQNPSFNRSHYVGQCGAALAV